MEPKQWLGTSFWHCAYDEAGPVLLNEQRAGGDEDTQPKEEV
jgi:hypothetical protein